MSTPEPRVEPYAGRLNRIKNAASGHALSLPAFRQPLHGITQKMLPSAKNRLRCEVLSRDSSGRNEPVTQGGLFLQTADMRKELVSCRRPQKIPSGLSIRGIGRVRTSDERNSRQPCVVKFCCRLVKVGRASEPAHGSHTIGLAIVVPAIRAADNKVDAQFVLEFPLPASVGQFRRKIRVRRQRNRRFQTDPSALDRAESDWGAAKAE